MRILVAALWAIAALAGCSAPHRTLTLVPALPATMPSCVAMGAVNTVRVTAQGDFPPEATLTASASAAGPATLSLPAATRDVVVEGFGPSGLAAFGRTPTLALDGLPAGPMAIAYGPPDGVCLTGPMRVARAGHRLTVLAGGGVLVTGGVNAGDGPATQVELYDPKTATFALTGASLDPRAVLAAASAPLPDGGALVTGGVLNDMNDLPAGIAFSGALRFDAAGRQVGEARLLVGGPRAGHSATVLADGRVLLAGGCQNFDAGNCQPGAALASTEIYDPKADMFAPGPPLLHARVGHSAVLRGDGTVLLVGGRGEGGGALAAEVIDPDEQRSFDAGTASGAGVGLTTGAALVAGGTTTPDVGVSLWLAPDEAPLALPPLAEARLGPALTPLDDGSVLVAGGGDGTLALFDGRAAVTALGASFSARDLAAARLGDGTVLLTGGRDAGGDAKSDAVVYFHSPLSPWASLPPLTLDGSADPYLPRRPDRAATDGGQLVVTAAAPAPDGRPAEYALVAGMEVADFTFDLLAGRRGAGAAAVLVGWDSDAAYDFVVLAPGRAVELWTVTSPRAGQTVAQARAGCSGTALPDGALPDGALAPVEIAWRAGKLTVSAGGTAMLSCHPPAFPRGAVGVAALSGTVAFDNLALTR
ncbi:MAG TPA: kelch repeat-containing protein [Polyangia bacterium]|nr:kelch repeat-containing protein [Polyangia bacterium]